MKPKALFKHDCDKCQYLGNLFVPSRNTMADVYRSCGKYATAVIFRYSSEPDDYSHHGVHPTVESDVGWMFKTPEELGYK
jgi:hypothetical protein